MKVKINKIFYVPIPTVYFKYNIQKSGVFYEENNVSKFMILPILVTRQYDI